jgi:hypothetical protein
MMKITRKSLFTGVVRTLELPITEAQVLAYWNGALLQEAFPSCTPGEREFFKTGVTDEEWDAAFGDSEGEE